MKISDKIPGQILKLIKERGPMFSAELATELGIDQDDIWNATYKAVRDGILKVEKEPMPSYKTDRKFNRYSMVNQEIPGDSQVVIQKPAHYDDMPTVPEGEFNPADPFRLARSMTPLYGVSIQPPESVVTILDNDAEEAPPKFSCAWWSNGETFHIKRGEGLLISMSKAETRQMLEYLLRNMREVYS